MPFLAGVIVLARLLWFRSRSADKHRAARVEYWRAQLAQYRPPPPKVAMLEEVKAIIGPEEMARVAGAEWALRTLQAPEKVRLAIDAWWRLSPAARESMLSPHVWLTGKYDGLRRLGEERR